MKIMVKTAFNTARVFSKRCFLLMVLILLPYLLFGQESGGNKKLKHGLNVDIGGQTNVVFGNRLITLDTIHSLINTSLRYYGYEIVPSTSFHGGIKYRIIIKERIAVNIGMIYYNCKYAYQSSTENLIRFAHFHDADSMVKRYDISHHNFATEVSLGYFYKGFTFSIGMKIFLAQITRTKKTDINGNITINNSEFVGMWNKSSFEGPYIFPELKVKYNFRLKKYYPGIYIGIDDFLRFSSNHRYGFWVNYGIVLPIINDFSNIKNK